MDECSSNSLEALKLRRRSRRGQCKRAAPPIDVTHVATDPSQTRPLTQSEVRDFVQRVQIALIMQGYDPGLPDGSVDSKSADRALPPRTS